jgi:hypothetical protein
MDEQSQDSRELLLRTDTELRDLAAQHHQLEGRLRELTTKRYVSDPELLDVVWW